MGNDWQDPRQKDRRLYSGARQPQDPQSSQSWDSSFQQDWRPQATGGPPSSRGPENRQPPGPRQSGGLAPHNGSGMLSRARNGGTSGPLGPQPGRTSGPLGPEPERAPWSQQPRTSGPLRPSSRGGSTPPGNGAVSRRSGAMRDYDPSEPEVPPQRSSGRQTSGRQSDPFNEPPMAGEQAGRRISGPTERAHNGGGLLSFARAASSTMRAIITGKHRASRTSRVEPAMMDGLPPVLPEGDEEQPHPKPYRRSRVRLVIHKRLERRSRSSQRLLIASLVTGFMVAVLVGLSIFGASNVSAFYQDTQGKLGALANPNGFSLTTRFYDRNGNLLWEMLDTQNNNADYRTYVPYGLVPRDVINATVDTEDKTFWTNSGVDVNSIIRAAIANVTNQQITQGGSTITQQLIKNAFFVDPNTGIAQENYQRKIQEALMSYAVTQQYSKQDILEFYLNIIPYGNLSRGIEAAAENYFDLMPGIDATTHQFKMGVQKLDLAQAALLAGLPQGPSLYNVCGGTDGQQDRRAAALARMHDVVLTSMLNIGDITSQQFQDADAEAHTPDFFKCRDEGTKLAPHFVDYVRKQLDQMLDPADPDGKGDYLLAHAGWNVYTTISLPLEQKVETTVYHYLFQPHLNHYTYEYPPAGQTAPPLSYSQNAGGHNINDSAVVVMDPNTGDILAMDGSGNYNKASNIKQGGEYNATTSPIQPGSSFKPIVYATAFEEGWSPATVLQDEYVCFPVQVDPNTQYSKAEKACGKWYAPTNYGFTFGTGKTTGESAPPPKPGIRIREALGNSLNIPAVQALYFAGEQNVIIQAERMGIHSATFHLNGIGPSIALGSAGISLLDMTDAYSVFANGGYHVAPRSILLITDSQGDVVPGGDFHTVTRTQVLSPQTAFLITSILADNNARIAEFGANNALTFGNGSVLYAAAKTGTTDDFKDNVSMGYTPYLAVGVWSGNANGATMTPNTLGITGASPIWHDVVMEATKLFHYPNSYWPKPGGVGRYMVNGETGLAPYQGTTGTYADWFNDAMIPDLS